MRIFTDSAFKDYQAQVKQEFNNLAKSRDEYYNKYMELRNKEYMFDNAVEEKKNLEKLLKEAHEANQQLHKQLHNSLMFESQLASVNESLSKALTSLKLRKG